MFNTSIPKNRHLSSKDAENFRELLKFYENKEYKKALKIANVILKSRPTHGETLALKGLVISSMDKKQVDEGYALIKQGMVNDEFSYVIWHVCSIFHRNAKNYEEAEKSYAKALQLDPENMNVVRDLSLMQMQNRRFDGLVASRSKLLTKQPGFRQNWTALAIAQHLRGDFAAAENTLNMFEEALKEPLPKEDNENSELMLYKNQIIYDSGDVQRALEHLDFIADKVLDTLWVYEARAKYLLELGKLKDAEKVYRILIKRNPEFCDYYYQLERALQIEDNNNLKAIMYRRLSKMYPKSDAPRSIALKFLTGDAFAKVVSEYLKSFFVRGVPSAFVNVKGLFKADSEKAAIIERVVLEYYAELKKESDSPITLLWVIYFLAQFNSHVQKFDAALEYINKAIEHTPTLVELYMTKARIYKRAGDYAQAAAVMQEARALDLQDRFVNTKAVKYLLRAGDIDTAVEVVSLFTKNDNEGKGVADLHDMQGLWFLKEQADAYNNAGNKGMALKRFHAIEEVFKEFHDDQFDFHFYCTRKGTIRAYLDMVHWEDKLHGLKHYKRAARGAVEIYLSLYDQEKNGQANGGVSSVDDGLTPEERKKLVRKAKKEKSKELKKEMEQLESKEIVDEDPFGHKLLAAKDPLEQALKLWKPVQTEALSAADAVDAGKLACEIFARQGKYLLAMQAINKASAAGLDWVYEEVAKVRAFSEADEAIAPTIKIVLTRSLTNLIADAFEGTVVEWLNRHFGDDTFDTAEPVFNYVSARQVCGGEEKARDIVKVSFKLARLNCTANEVIRGLRIVEQWGCAEDVAEYKKLASEKWSLATALQV
ncbi:N-terminal acetyltransferase A, auxiliary subunit [Nadsonia fulvescens var. elongata DSM 6958]|uniref:N-terminal acetyltransferase A, auxiliary subunit n=1 Tax=Nadsonia fulvescens var. elongata DSM 6958 TaxID=857566 RepID=A0A1E3PFV8_9ASCO|nr:N-terminal acetyltransferase A, auxiliary subunit [Nadsonia fulvescens var. elongata DSM 6958]